MKVYEQYADVYDFSVPANFDPEAGWLSARFGAPLKTVLELGCGSGRLFPLFAARGVAVVGLDASAVMLSRAAERMKRLGLPAPETYLGDMTRFDLGRTFDGAICPLYTFPYLTAPGAAAAHLECVARHLAPRRRYLLQFDLRSKAPYAPFGGDDAFQWFVEKDGVRMSARWGARAYDPHTGIETQFSRYEFLSGPRRGTVVDEPHSVLLWDWDDWRALLDRSPFRQVEAYSAEPGAAAAAQPLGPGLYESRFTWHVLERRG